MKIILKYGLIILGAIIGILVIAILLAGLSTGIRLNRIHEVDVKPIVLPSGNAAINEGRRLALIHCIECHGSDMSGRVLFDDPQLGVAWASNLTPGKGGVGAYYTDEDWIRSIRHGIGADGKSLFVMPSNDYWYMSDKDLANLIASLKNLPPVDKNTAELELTMMARVMVGIGAFRPVIRAEAIDHSGVRPPEPAPGVNAEYGEYLVNISSCRTCHGEQLSGGKDPNPEAPPGPNLTPGGALKRWTDADFIKFMRTGVSLSGEQRDPEFMPWPTLGKMRDEELASIFMYLGSLPALE